MRRRHYRRLREYFQEEIPIETRFFSERYRFCDRLHVQTEQSVDDQFHRGPGSARPQVEILLGYGRKDWLAGVEHVRVPATEESQCALLSSGRTAGDGDIEDFDPALSAHPMKHARRIRRDCAHLDDDGCGVRAG